MGKYRRMARGIGARERGSFGASKTRTYAHNPANELTDNLYTAPVYPAYSLKQLPRNSNSCLSVFFSFFKCETRFIHFILYAINCNLLSNYPETRIRYFFVIFHCIFVQTRILRVAIFFILIRTRPLIFR